MDITTGIELSELVRERFDDLTKSEKRIASYLLKNQDEAAFLSAAELAARLNLSEATVVRFAQSLGFSGFPDLRMALQSSFRLRVTHSARLRGRLDNLRQDGDILERLTVSEIDYLTQNLLRDRDRTFVFGLHASVSLVDLLEIRLRRFGRHVISLTTTGREMLEPLLLMTSNDLLFVIAFFDVNPALRLVIDHAHACACPVVFLTDTLGSILGDEADVVLAARRGPVSAFHSLTVPMTIINTLLLALAQSDWERASSNLDRLDELRRAYAAALQE
jgi:DNA-binding MurR/RpiR family transcriptional regulator